MKDILKSLCLQFFADAGTLVNATETFVNAHTGETSSRSSPYEMSSAMKAYYNTELLENVKPLMIYGQFAMKTPLPAGRKGQVQWRKWNTFARAEKLTEGVIPTGQRFGQTEINGYIDQYGTYTSITDKLELRSYDDVIQGATEEMANSAAETQEALIRNTLYTGTNVFYCDKITVATEAFAAAVTKESELTEGSGYGCRLTPRMVNKAATILRKNRVPRINGKYAAVVHPSVIHDLRECEGWKEAHKYDATTQIFNGEVGELHGVRFIEDAMAPVFRGADLASDSATLSINYVSGYSGAITSVTFDGGTVEADELIGRKIMINGVVATVTDNDTTTITFASTNFGSIANDTVIYPGEHARDGIACYATYFFGKDSFAIIDPEGGALQMIAHDKSEIGGPLDQYSTIGYKFETNGATYLYPERCLRVMSTSSMSDVDEDNW